MTFPASFPLSQWILFGTLGTICSILFTVILWRWYKTGQSQAGSEPYSNFTFLGLAFLYASGLICCGICGPPGYALSSNPALVNKEWIFRACFLSLTFSILAWTLMLIGQKKTMTRHLKTVEKIKDLEAKLIKANLHKA